MNGSRSLLWGIIQPMLVARGFRQQRKTNAFLVRPETTCVLNLQKSQWGDQFYINCGVWLNRFGTNAEPKEYKCHIRWRADWILPADADLIVDALNLERPIEDSERFRMVTDMVDRCALSPLGRCDSEANAIAMAATFAPGSFLLVKQLNPQEQPA